jgi:hypothetical protein
MRSVVALASAVFTTTGVVVGAQSLLLKPAPQHATVVAATSVARVSPGTTLTLWADVTPNPSIHIYAEGAKDFSPVSLKTTPNPSITTGRPTYPKPDVASAPGSTDAVPAYRRPFRIAVPATVKSTAEPGDTITVGGVVSYQACDDRLCYPVTAAPLTWTLSVQ